MPIYDFLQTASFKSECKHSLRRGETSKMEEITVKTGFENMDYDRVTQMLSQSYWVPGIQRETVERAAAHSAETVGAFAGGVQIGYARVISDLTRFAYLADVFVDESFRGRGVAQRMLSHLLGLPEFATVARWVLTTKDAQGLYQKLGFQTVSNPENWLMLQNKT